MKNAKSTAALTTKQGIRDWKRGAFIFLFILPAFFFLALFLYYPIEETFRIAMTKSHGLGAEPFVGLDNYIKLFKDPEFQAGLLHVPQWAIWSVAIQLPLAFVIAFALTFYNNKMTGSLKAIYYLSNVMPSAIVAMLGRFIFQPTTGIIASFSNFVGWKWLNNIDFLGSPKMAFWSVFIVATWAYTGFPIVYLMSRMEQIPKEVREAAEIDGATGWRYAFSIVMPELNYAFRILTVIMVTGSLKLFDLPNMMTAGGPGYSTTTLSITLYRHGFVNWNYGKAAAIGVVIFLLSLGFTIIQFSGQKKEGGI